MRLALRRAGGLVALLLSAAGLFGVLVLTVASAQNTTEQVSPAAARLSAATSAAPVAFRPLTRESLNSKGAPPVPASLPAGAAAPDFTFDKKVMLKSDYDAWGCDRSLESLTVYYSTTVAYCYFFTNIGSTTWVTHSLTDDKLGSTGTFQQSVPPDGLIGFAAVPPALLQDVTNTATWTAIDEGGVQLARTDKITVKVVIPLTGHVFVDQNGDGVRNPTETAGVGGVNLNLRPGTSDPTLARYATSFATGYYEFLTAVEGTYTVSVDLPSGYVATSATEMPVTLVFGVPKVVNFGVRLATPTPTSTSTSTPEVTSTSTPTDTPLPTGTSTPTNGPTPTNTATPQDSPTPTPSGTPTATPTIIWHVYLPRIVYVPAGVRPPLAPSLMSITPPGDNVSYTLSWTPIYGAEQYEVQQGTTPFFAVPVQQVYVGDRSSFDMTSNGIGTFYYRVRSINVAGVSSWSETQSAYVSWETEPNNVLTQATSGIAPDQTVYALPDDPNDFFEVTTSEAGWVTARVDDMIGQSVRIILYRDNVGNVLSSDTSAPYQVTGYGEPGKFYVRVFVGAGYSSATPYHLSISYP